MNKRAVIAAMLGLAGILLIARPQVWYAHPFSVGEVGGPLYGALSMSIGDSSVVVTRPEAVIFMTWRRGAWASDTVNLYREEEHFTKSGRVKRPSALWRRVLLHYCPTDKRSLPSTQPSDGAMDYIR